MSTVALRELRENVPARSFASSAPLTPVNPGILPTRLSDTFWNRPRMLYCCGSLHSPFQRTTKS